MTANPFGLPRQRAVTAALALALASGLSCARAQDLSGRYLAATCANCHGTDGHAVGDTLKPLAGMPAERIVETMTGFKSGTLPATVMHQIAKGFSDEQVRALAAYFAAQPAR